MQAKESVEDFKSFMEARLTAAQAYVTGDAGPLLKLAADESPATFFGPNGKVEEGAQQVASVYERDAAMFGKDGETHFEILQINAGSDLAYWVGFQIATVSMNGKTVPMKLRITEIFRRENGEWKLVHRHADRVNDEQQKPAD